MSRSPAGWLRVLRGRAARLARLCDLDAPPMILEDEMWLVQGARDGWRAASGHDHERYARDRAERRASALRAAGRMEQAAPGRLAEMQAAAVSLSDQEFDALHDEDEDAGRAAAERLAAALPPRTTAEVVQITGVN